MFCPFCGTKNDEDSSFCGNCGKRMMEEELNDFDYTPANGTVSAVGGNTPDTPPAPVEYSGQDSVNSPWATDPAQTPNNPWNSQPSSADAWNPFTSSPSQDSNPFAANQGGMYADPQFPGNQGGMYADSPYNGMDSYNPPEENKKNSKMVLIAAIVAVIALLCIGGTVFLLTSDSFGSKSSDSGSAAREEIADEDVDEEDPEDQPEEDGADEEEQAETEKPSEAEETDFSSDSAAINLVAGDIYTLGKYKQSNSTPYEPLEWIVLEVKGNTALLLSSRALQFMPYHQEYSQIHWDQASIREWLNVEFFENAFSDEWDSIQSVSIVTGSYGNSNETIESEDLVFLLSAEEAARYQSAIGGLTCKATEASGSSDPGMPCGWWLRSPGFDNSFAAYVNEKGEIINNGELVYLPVNGVRPAIWVTLE